MDIRHLRIENFRSLRLVDWEPGRLNVFIGPNGSGKSNLLQALELIRAAASDQLREMIMRKGGIAPLIWSGASQTDSKIRFSVVSGPIELAGYETPEAHTYILELRQLGHTGEFIVDFELLKKYGHEQGTRTGPFPLLERSGATVSIYDKDSNPFYTTQASDQTRTTLSLVSELFKGTVAFEFQRQLQAWGIYRDLRVDEGATIRHSAVLRRETRISADGQNLIPVLYNHYEGEFKRELDKAMSAAFPDDFGELKFRAAPEDGRIQLRLRRKHTQREDAATDLSDGTIRFLLLLTILAVPDPPPLIALDQPELGLHPSMLPILAEFAAEASRRSQVVLATHSSQLLDAFQGTIPAVTVFTWTGDQTEAKTLAGEELTAWVKDYSLGRFAFSGEAQAVL